MSYLKYFVPDEQLEHAEDLNPEALRKKGIRGICFDIDNTLVPHGAQATAASVRLVKHLKEEGFSICLISNNDENRVAPFAGAVDCLAVWDAGKPLKKAYKKALQLLNLEKNQVAFAGDQLFTDVYGARRAGFWTVLVQPIDLSSDPPHTKLKRVLEKPFFFYIRCRKRKEK